jgi:hypothetical protein
MRRTKLVLAALALMVGMMIALAAPAMANAVDFGGNGPVDFGGNGPVHSSFHHHHSSPHHHHHNHH